MKRNRVFIIIPFIMMMFSGCSFPDEPENSGMTVTETENDRAESIARAEDEGEAAGGDPEEKGVDEEQEEDSGFDTEEKGVDEIQEEDPGFETDKTEGDEEQEEDPGLDPEERERILSEKKLKISENTIVVPGIERDMDILFIADSHISLADERDAALMTRASARYGMMLDANGRPADQTFHEFIDYTGAEEPDLLILGGDITDSALYASVDFIKEELKGSRTPYLLSLGNHDFEYGPEYFTKKAYDVYRPRLLELSRSKSGAHLLSLGGMYVFAVDDFNNQYTKVELEAFKKIYDDGRPILFVSHVPIEPQTGDTVLHDKTLKIFGSDKMGHSRVLIGHNSCVPNEYTAGMLDLILAEDSPVFCVLAGHIHYAHEDMLNNKVVQIITGAAYNSEGVLLHLKKST